MLLEKSVVDDFATEPYCKLSKVIKNKAKLVDRL